MPFSLPDCCPCSQEAAQGHLNHVGPAVSRWLCPTAQLPVLTLMLGSSRECRARMMASSETRVSPLVWISSTAIWGRKSAAVSAGSQALAQVLGAHFSTPLLHR